MLQKFTSLNWLTIGKAILKAVLAAVVAYLLPLLKAGTMPGLSQVQVIAAIAIGTALAYLVKNVLTIGAPNGSGFASLNGTDIGFAFLQTVLNTVFVGFIPVLTSGAFPSGAEIGTAIKAGLVTGVTYIATNFFSDTSAKAPAATPTAAASASK